MLYNEIVNYIEYQLVRNGLNVDDAVTEARVKFNTDITEDMEESIQRLRENDRI